MNNMWAERFYHNCYRQFYRIYLFHYSRVTISSSPVQVSHYGLITSLFSYVSELYSFHLASTSSICEIVLPLVSLQVVGKIDCWGLKVFISWKNFLVSFLFWLYSICNILLFVHTFFFCLIRTFASILIFFYTSWLALVFYWSHLDLALFFLFMYCLHS